jgi:hypothetical protein
LVEVIFGAGFAHLKGDCDFNEEFTSNPRSIASVVVADIANGQRHSKMLSAARVAFRGLAPMWASQRGAFASCRHLTTGSTKYPDVYLHSTNKPGEFALSYLKEETTDGVSLRMKITGTID